MRIDAGGRARYLSGMGLRDRVRSSLRSVLDRFSGEFSAATPEIRPDLSTSAEPVAADPEVTVTRARLKRPKDAKETREG